MNLNILAQLSRLIVTCNTWRGIHIIINISGIQAQPNIQLGKSEIQSVLQGEGIRLLY